MMPGGEARADDARGPRAIAEDTPGPEASAADASGSDHAHAADAAQTVDGTQDVVRARARPWQVWAAAVLLVVYGINFLATGLDWVGVKDWRDAGYHLAGVGPYAWAWWFPLQAGVVIAFALVGACLAAYVGLLAGRAWGRSLAVALAAVGLFHALGDVWWYPGSTFGEALVRNLQMAAAALVFGALPAWLAWTPATDRHFGPPPPGGRRRALGTACLGGGLLMAVSGFLLLFDYLNFPGRWWMPAALSAGGLVLLLNGRTGTGGPRPAA